MPSCLLLKWLCGNSCTWADDVRLPIAGSNEPTMATLYIRAFQIVLRGGRWVSPRWGRWIVYFARRENFFTRSWEPEEEWFWTFEPFAELKTASFKIKISITCVHKEHEIKTKRYRSNDYSYKWSFHWVITWKSLFSGQDGRINFWWGGGGGWQKFCGRRGVLEGFSQMGEMSKFSAGERDLPPSSTVLKNIRSCSRQTKIPDNSNVLLTFNNNTCIDFRTVYKHVSVPSYFIQVI